MTVLMPHTTTATELQRNYRRVVKRAKRLKKPVVILSNNQPDMVLIDYELIKKKQIFSEKKITGKNNSKPDVYKKLFGSWTKKEAEEFNQRIEEMFEVIDEEQWK